MKEICPMNTVGPVMAAFAMATSKRPERRQALNTNIIRYMQDI